MGDVSTTLGKLVTNLETSIASAEKSAEDFPKAKADRVEMKKIAQAMLLMLTGWFESGEVSC